MLESLFECVLDSIPRADQRRWAAYYVTGLAVVPGRKSIRRIAGEIDGDIAARSVTQCLQQFVNQSPWDWGPVRRDLVRAVSSTMTPRAWVLQDVEFVKDGASSVGVGNQYAPGLQRTVNCQLANLLWLAGDGGWVPADWRLGLPKCWDEDVERRTKAHLPESERHRPEWAQVLEIVDEMTGDWGVRPLPIVADRRHHQHQLEPLIAGLEQRGAQYLLRINDRAPVAVHGPTRRVISAGEVMRAARREPHGTSGRRHAAGTGTGGVSCPPVAHAVLPTATACRGAGGFRTRRLVAALPVLRSRPAGLWYTNLPVHTALGLLATLNVDRTAESELAALRVDSGLDHFEGRSFRGWHHHVTLASIAHARRVRVEMEQERHLHAVS